MPRRFCILGSGSNGNCALLQTDSTRVLIDAGFSARKLGQLLDGVGLTLADIDAIFLTHEHGDHAAGIDGLKKHPGLPVFANAATARAVQLGRAKFRPTWQIFETGAAFRFRDLTIESFSVPHDAADPVGFLFRSGHEGDLLSPLRSLVWMTDLGHAPPHIRERVRQADVLVLEANHCPELLKSDTRRPWSVKQRIGGRHGHLSNEGVRELLASVPSPRWQRIFLAHLSRDCNRPDLVESVLAPLGLPCSVVEAGGSTPFYDFV